ncbi:MAG: protein PhnA [Myxococcota bacterium]|jgi:protein PhnA
MDDLMTRSGGQCELCGATDSPAAWPVSGGPEDAAALLCATCHPAVAAGESLSGGHWFCLQESAWSEVPAVVVLSVRLLRRLPGETWAADLLDQVYLDDDTRAWADSGAADAGPKTTDSNGALLSDGDSVTLIKDLTVKGAGFTAKRGTLVKNIRTGSDPTHIEGRVNKMTIMLKTAFLKKA